MGLSLRPTSLPVHLRPRRHSPVPVGHRWGVPPSTPLLIWLEEVGVETWGRLGGNRFRRSSVSRSLVYLIDRTRWQLEEGDFIVEVFRSPQYLNEWRHPRITYKRPLPYVPTHVFINEYKLSVSGVLWLQDSLWTGFTVSIRRGENKKSFRKTIISDLYVLYVWYSCTKALKSVWLKWVHGSCV